MKRLSVLTLIVLCSILTSGLSQVSDASFDKYHDLKDVNVSLSSIQRQNPNISRVHRLAVSSGEFDVNLLEIGPEINQTEKQVPAVLVVANMEGHVPISTEAALYLAKLVSEKPDVRKDLTWYILPCGNPDAARRYYLKPLYVDTRNAKPYNDDMDENIDEDGFEDINNDGLITQMRVKDPGGEWLPAKSDSRLMKKADPAKGEKGVYKIYTEGIDNDGDGLYNEDGPGGVNIGTNFPQFHEPFTPTSGIWPGSEAESYQLMKFVFDHPEIAMTVTFGFTNWCVAAPTGGRTESRDFTKMNVPASMASWLKADPSRTYDLDELTELLTAVLPPGFELTKSIVAQVAELGPYTN
ncbi:hypothetical protein BVY01_00260, partial [bacterium I07]